MITARSFSVLSAISVTLGGFLLFMVQPLLAKTLLPSFGGSASTWTVCMLFFQGMLLAGYAYVFAVTRWLPARAAVIPHLTLLAGALAWQTDALPVVADISSPEWNILAHLFRMVGLPVFVLVTTSPLLQNWLEDLRADAGHHFALSNAGAFFALLAYPFLIDVSLDINEQLRLWSTAFVVYALALGVCTVARARAPSTRRGDDFPGPKSSLPVAAWAFAGCAIFMSASACANEAAPAVAFLWVLPLALYLVSFIVAFSPTQFARHAWPALALSLAAAISFCIPENPPPLLMVLKVVCLSLVTLAGCTYCHARMAAVAGESAKQSWFYVACAAGGFLAGLFVTFLAPHVYPSNWELPVAVASLGIFLALRNSWPRPARLATAALACVALALWIQREVAFSPYTLWRERGFYGTLRVLDLPDRVLMIHTGTAQGAQIKGAGDFSTAACDFNKVSGVGLAMVHNFARRQPGGQLKVGMIGMGVGMILAYGRPGDRFDFFEVNPSVIHAATNYFTFLRDTPAEAKVFPGDGRHLLDQKVREEGARYDVLIVDAFHGGAPPLHLLTKEAFALYFAALKPGGVLAIDADALSFDFSPLHRGLSAEFATPVAWIRTHACEGGQSWAVYTHDKEFWRDPQVAKHISRWPDQGRWQLTWTDSRHNLMTLFDVPWQDVFIKMYRTRPVRGFDLSSVSN